MPAKNLHKQGLYSGIASKNYANISEEPTVLFFRYMSDIFTAKYSLTLTQTKSHYQTSITIYIYIYNNTEHHIATTLIYTVIVENTSNPTVHKFDNRNST